MRVAHLRKETENKKSGRSKRNDRKDTSQILFMGISSPEIRKLILSGTLHERNSLARIHKNVCGRKRIAKIYFDYFLSFIRKKANHPNGKFA